MFSLKKLIKFILIEVKSQYPKEYNPLLQELYKIGLSNISRFHHKIFFQGK